MPKLGHDMDEGTIDEWLVETGTTVTRGDVLAMIETDKTNVEMEALVSGTLVEITAAVGAVVKVGDVIAYIEADGEPDS